MFTHNLDILENSLQYIHEPKKIDKINQQLPCLNLRSNPTSQNPIKLHTNDKITRTQPTINHTISQYGNSNRKDPSKVNLEN